MNSKLGTTQADLFGTTDAIVKFVLEGHDRGVNWATFHPSLPLIVSAADDRQVKLWRMSDTKAWEVDTCRGHFNNVSCAIFHPRSELILSNSEDKTIRVWDMQKRTVLQSFRREHDRFWVITSHPSLSLFAAGHDNGFVVFKLERERPASTLNGTQLFYVKEKSINCFDLKTGSNASVSTLTKMTGTAIRTLSFNPAENAFLVANASEYELIHVSNKGYNDDSSVRRGNGQSAVFISRNRFAVLDKAVQTVFIKDMRNEITKQFKGPSDICNIFYAGMKNILLVTPNSVILFDTELKTQVAEIQLAGVRYAIWSPDMSMVALLSKHSTLCRLWIELLTF